MKAAWQKYRLDFRFTAITSRDSLTTKDTYYIKVWDECQPEVVGIGEAALFRGLSCDDVPEYEQVLDDVCKHIDRYVGDVSALAPYPSIRFGVETAVRDLKSVSAMTGTAKSAPATLNSTNGRSGLSCRCSAATTTPRFRKRAP